MSEDNLWAVRYHANKLAEEQEEMRRVIKLTYPPYNQDGHAIEETYRVRDLLESILAHTQLLNTELERLVVEPKKSLWKRLLNK